jgi:hypothetical protein
LLLVIALVALISTFAATRLTAIGGWKLEGELRRFSSTWQFLFNEAYGRGETYRLVLNIDENYYQVLREVQLDRNEVRNVDYLKNLRTRREQERRKEEENEKLASLDEEFTAYDRTQSGPIDGQYYRTKFRDVYADVRLSRPLEFPKLADKKHFVPGLKVRDVFMQGADEPIDEGEVIFRFSPQGASDFAVIHFTLGTGEEEEEDLQIYTAVSHPATGNLSLVFGDKEYKWDPKKNEVEY